MQAEKPVNCSSRNFRGQGALGQLHGISRKGNHMRRAPSDHPLPLHDLAAIRRMEAAAGCFPSGPSGPSLMAQAGLSVARMAQAIVPHARTVWIACGPGNNGGDGLHAALHLHRWAQRTRGRTQVIVTHPGADPDWPTGNPRFSEWQEALGQVLSQGISLHEAPPPVFDLAIDAVFGIGLSRPLEGRFGDWVARLREAPCPVLHVDVPSGLDAMTGMDALAPGGAHQSATASGGPRHTITFLTLKPGLFTGIGRDLAGEVWLDALGLDAASEQRPAAWLYAEPAAAALSRRAQASHKGHFGEVLVVGGQDIALHGEGMTGAAVLAARAALHAGAGRVYACLLGSPAGDPVRFDPIAPELMFRQMNAVLHSTLPDRAVVVCGCGAGQSMETVLPELLQRCTRMVLDADALNAIARQGSFMELLQRRAPKKWITVLTPHPLEAARLLNTTTSEVMSNRLLAAQTLADRTGAIAVLKGSGTVIAMPGNLPSINASGGPALATAGTGDVLAGMLGAALSAPSIRSAQDAVAAVCHAVYQHGMLADRWPKKCADQGLLHESPTLTAGRLAQAILPLF
ncbi:MAG: NAD(P)H-hydrate dehydratase [Hydrogenophaga sp.]